MKNLMLAVVASIVALSFTAQHALAGDQDFTLVNKTGVEIHQVLVAPSESDSWGSDIMGKDTLADDGSVEIKFHRDEDAQDWDLKIIDKSGNSVTWSKLRLTKISKVTLKIEDGKPVAYFD